MVGAKLGQQAITTSLKAGAVGFAIVVDQLMLALSRQKIQVPVWGRIFLLLLGIRLFVHAEHLLPACLISTGRPSPADRHRWRFRLNDCKSTALRSGRYC